MGYYTIQEILDKRTYFIGDRVAVSQVLFQLFTGAITYSLELLNLTDFVINHLWWLFLLILPISTIILLAIKKISLYFDHHWLFSSLIFLIIWSSFTIYLGVLVDEFSGYGNAFFISLFIGLIYFIGYFYAKMIRKVRHSLSGRTLAGVVLIISLVLILVNIGLGIYTYNNGINDIQGEQALKFMLFMEIFTDIDLNWIRFLPLSVEYADIINNQICRIGIYIMLTGVGIVISMLMHYFMFYCLHDPKGLDVEENPPNQLYIRVMIVSIILTFISWILLLVLFPPIPAGGKKKGGRKRLPRTYSSRYRTYLHYGKEPPEGYSEVLTEAEWKEYELGKERRII